MKKEISDLLGISDLYGRNKDLVIAGGGNTSFKDGKHIWIKASGSPLAGMMEHDLVMLNREKLSIIAGRQYSEDPVTREEEVKSDLFAAIEGGAQGKRPSVETSLHNLIGFAFVVHLHPTILNGILCSRNSKNLITQFFGTEVLFIQYIDPGYTLFKKLDTEIAHFRETHGKEPSVIFLENHGVFVEIGRAHV